MAVSWARDAVAAIRKIVLIEERMEILTAQVKQLPKAIPISIAAGTARGQV